MGRVLSGGFFAQAVFITAALLTTGLTHLILFALFWVACIATLIGLLEAKTWQGQEFFGYSALMITIIFALLFSYRIFLDPKALLLTIDGLLLVSIVVTLIDQGPKPPKNVMYVVEKSKVYHQGKCPSLKKEKNLWAMDEEEAKKRKLTPCPVCLKKR